MKLRFAQPQGYWLKGLLPLSVVLPLEMARRAIQVAKRGALRRTEVEGAPGRAVCVLVWGAISAGAGVQSA